MLEHFDHAVETKGHESAEKNLFLFRQGDVVWDCGRAFVCLL